MVEWKKKDGKAEENKRKPSLKSFGENRDLGLVRVLRFRDIFLKVGAETGKQYEFWYNTNWNAGVDAVVYEVNERGRLEVVAAIESTNYGSAKYSMDEERFRRYVKDLRWFGKYGAKMFLLISYVENLGRDEKTRNERLTALLDEGIYVIPLGGQDVVCDGCGRIIAGREERANMGSRKYLCLSCLKEKGGDVCIK